MSTFNDSIIVEFRANNGRVDSAGFGTDLILLHSTGARTGEPRVNPAMSLRDDDSWLIVGSAKGAADDPAWAHNLRAHDEVSIESHGDGGIDVVDVTATELSGAEHDTALARFIERAPTFASYRRKAAATRAMPVFRLTPKATRDATGPDTPDRDVVVARPETDPSLPDLTAEEEHARLRTAAETLANPDR